jgi:hypothetical protein
MVSFTKFTLKYYTFLKVKKQLKKNELLFLYYISDSNSKIWFTVEKLLKNFNLKHYKFHNKITKKVFNQSIYKKFKTLINSPLIFVIFKVLPKLFSSYFLKLNSILTFIGIKLNKTFYFINQINKVESIKYDITMIIFYSFLKKKLEFSIQTLFFRNNMI